MVKGLNYKIAKIIVFVRLSVRILNHYRVMVTSTIIGEKVVFFNNFEEDKELGKG